MNKNTDDNDNLYKFCCDYDHNDDYYDDHKIVDSA